MVKRGIDIVLSLSGLIIFSPLFTISLLLVWLQDFRSPFYMAQRVGQDFKLFSMVKIRSMTVDAFKTGVVSTSSKDNRITPVGHLVRRYKIDELSQLWNVLIGNMSLVGPRPNIIDEVNLYTKLEKKLLSVKPGITDFSSIVFSDLNDILKDSKNPNLDYNQLVRPWKSRLGIVYIENKSTTLDIKLIFITAISIFNKKKAILIVHNILKKYKIDNLLLTVAKRESPLFPHPILGSDKIVYDR